eukprot:1027717_1
MSINHNENAIAARTKKCTVSILPHQSLPSAFCPHHGLLSVTLEVPSHDTHNQNQRSHVLDWISTTLIHTTSNSYYSTKSYYAKGFAAYHCFRCTPMHTNHDTASTNACPATGTKQAVGSSLWYMLHPFQVSITSYFRKISPNKMQHPEVQDF